MTELQLKQAALARQMSTHHKGDVLADSGLDVTRLSVLVQEIHRMARESGLDIEILTTVAHPHPAFRTTTLRVKSPSLCVLSRTYP